MNTWQDRYGAQLLGHDLWAGPSSSSPHIHGFPCTGDAPARRVQARKSGKPGRHGEGPLPCEGEGLLHKRQGERTREATCRWIGRCQPLARRAMGKGLCGRLIHGVIFSPLALRPPGKNWWSWSPYATSCGTVHGRWAALRSCSTDDIHHSSRKCVFAPRSHRHAVKHTETHCDDCSRHSLGVSFWNRWFQGIDWGRELRQHTDTGGTTTSSGPCFANHLETRCRAEPDPADKKRLSRCR